ncbi:hypothetical protein HYR69_08655 [Candidatus Sumerlaeota bacterium]|nr:hypothetical protein [Candidatus Sumerlaeota bacterium]
MVVIKLPPISHRRQGLRGRWLKPVAVLSMYLTLHLKRISPESFMDPLHNPITHRGNLKPSAIATRIAASRSQVPQTAPLAADRMRNRAPQNLSSGLSPSDEA